MNRQAQSGMTLLEVLVAVFVLSVGLIGVAKLQVTSKQNNFDAIQRITATTLAYEIIERMRSNPTNLTEYVTNNGTYILNNSSIPDEPTPRCNTSASCDGTELAKHDLWEFKEALSGATETKGSTYTGGLDSFTACISGPSTGAAGTYTIAIAWKGRTKLSNPTINDCGETSGLYGDGDDSNKYRRVIEFVTYIDNQDL